jgi:hypothetical protein
MTTVPASVGHRFDALARVQIIRRREAAARRATDYMRRKVRRNALVIWPRIGLADDHRSTA